MLGISFQVIHSFETSRETFIKVEPGQGSHPLMLYSVAQMTVVVRYQEPPLRPGEKAGLEAAYVSCLLRCQPRQ